MPFSLKLDLPFFRLDMDDTFHIWVALHDGEFCGVGGSPKQHAVKLKEDFEDIFLKQGRFDLIFTRLPDRAEFQQEEVPISVEVGQLGNPNLLEFNLPFYYTDTDLGVYGVIPSLGMEHFADDLEALKAGLEQNGSLKCKVGVDLFGPHYVLSQLWFQEQALFKMPQSLEIPFPDEVFEDGADPDRSILQKIASPWKPEELQTFGVDDTLRELEQAIQQSVFPNILLVGPPGVGKTALLEALTWKLAIQQPKLTVWKSTASQMIKGLMADTSWQDQLPKVVKALNQQNGILYLTNLADFFEIGHYEGNDQSVAEYMLHFIEQGQLKVIAEVSAEELAFIDVKSPRLKSFFQQFKIVEPRENLLEIIHSKIEILANAKGIYIEPEAIQTTISLMRRFSPYSGFPGRPVRFLELLLDEKGVEGVTLNRRMVIDQFCKEGGLPIFMIDPEEPLTLPDIRTFFYNRIFGQEEAIERIVDVLIAVRTAMTTLLKPIASFLFVGPTGVGKTEVAKVLSTFMFGSEHRMIRFDMSEYATPAQVSQLIGVSITQEGLLPAAVRRQPFSVILFDEVEKADPSFFDLLLQILGEGRLSDSRGKVANFCSCIIIMTSNIGADFLQFQQIGWNDQNDQHADKEKFVLAVEKFFRPELYNRIDQIVPFESLDAETVRFIVEKEIKDLSKRYGLAARNLKLLVEESAKDYFGEKGYDPRYGARQLLRTLEDELLTPLAKTLNQLPFEDRAEIVVEAQNGKLVFDLNAQKEDMQQFLESMDHVYLANMASDSRRKWQNMKNGPLLLRFQSDLSILEQKNRREGESFWQNYQQAATYSRMLELQEEGQQIFDRALALEQDVGLAFLAGSNSPDDIEEAIRQWEAEFHSFQRAMYTHLHPDEGECFLSIIGTEPGEAGRFYAELIEKAGFEYEIQAGYRMGPPVQKGDFVNGPLVMKNISHQELQTLGKQDEKSNLYALVFTLRGAAVFPYFSEEPGLFKWEDRNSENKYTYRIIIETIPPVFTSKILRIEFFTSVHRRGSSPGFLEDTSLGIAKEIPRKKQIHDLFFRKEKKIARYLDRAFGC